MASFVVEGNKQQVVTMMSTRLRLGTLLAAAVTASLLTPITAASEQTSPPPDVGIAAVTFADEFNAPAGTPPDAGKWQRETGDNVNNHERQWYTTSTSNAAHDGQGNLVITARRENPGNFQCWYGRCEYTSARLNTAGRFTQTYGHFEARIKMSRGQGMWPAFWMLGNDIGNVGWPNSGEIDIMENIGREPNTVHGTVHGPGYSGAEGIGGGFNNGVFADAFHVFAIDWVPGRITWSVDGQTYFTVTPSSLGGDRWVFDHPFFLILNLAVGGFWPGDPNASTPFPNTLTIDYIRVTNDSTGGGGGRITGLGGKCVDVAGTNSANGTPVQLWDCNGTAAQSWTRNSDGTIRALGKCLDVSGASTADGAQLQLWDCNGTNAQRFTVTAAREIIDTGANKCVDAAGNSSANGTRLQIWSCTRAANQLWTFT